MLYYSSLINFVLWVSKGILNSGVASLDQIRGGEIRVLASLDAIVEL